MLGTIAVVAAIPTTILIALRVFADTRTGQAMIDRSTLKHLAIDHAQVPAPTHYPVILKCGLLAANGTMERCKLAIHQESLVIHIGAMEKIKAWVAIEDIEGLLYERPRKDTPLLAGFSVVTAKGQYQFFKDGFTAETTMKRTVKTICAIHGGLPEVDTAGLLRR